jgi:hypothetical protein
MPDAGLKNKEMKSESMANLNAVFIKSVTRAISWIILF